MREGVVQRHVSGDFATAAATRQIDTLYHESHHTSFFFPSHLVRSYDELTNSTVARANEHCPNTARQVGDLSQAEASR